MDAAEDDDDLDGWIDEYTSLSEEGQKALAEQVLPVKLLLVKVRDCLDIHAPRGTNISFPASKIGFCCHQLVDYPFTGVVSNCR